MRLPFPERIPLRYALYFAGLLCTVQLFQGTPATFSLCCFLFVIIATFTFNLAGGFTRPSGGYVFFYAVLAVILGLVWKAFLGEPANSNLKQPLLTFEIYVGGITAMLAAVFLSRKLGTKRAILRDMLADADMMNAAIGCMITGIVLTATLLLVPHHSGSILSAFSQLDVFLPLAIILGTIAQIRMSNGSSSVNAVVLAAGGAVFFGSGIMGFSKQGMLAPLLAWLIAVASQRYKLALYQVIGMILAFSFISYYLVPYSQYGRNYQTESVAQNIQVAISLASNLSDVREQYEQNAASQSENRVEAYFDTPQGLMDRLQMISPDDALINVTEQNGPIGYGPIVFYFENLVPHLLWPGKPTIGFGNIYAHEIGMISEEDYSTGISFTPTGEAFHIARWAGIFVIAPLLWIPLFTLFDSLCGDVRKYPWGLLAIVLFAHIAPEGMLGGIVYCLWYLAIVIVFAAFISGYFAPVIGSVFTLSNRTGLRRNVTVRSIPRRLPPVRPSENSNP